MLMLCLYNNREEQSVVDQNLINLLFLEVAFLSSLMSRTYVCILAFVSYFMIMDRLILMLARIDFRRYVQGNA